MAWPEKARPAEYHAGAEGLYSHQALEDAVVRAERAEARAATAEQHLVQLGTPREVLTVLQRKCSEAEVEASRARARPRNW